MPSGHEEETHGPASRAFGREWKRDERSGTSRQVREGETVGRAETGKGNRDRTVGGDDRALEEEQREEETIVWVEEGRERRLERW